MEKGIIPWQRPWNGGECCISHTTGKPYSWLNQLMLGGKVGEWITFKQCKAEGGSVKRGEKGCPVVFWSFNDKKIKETDADGNEVIRIVRGHPFLKYYTVFHIDQCEGIKPKFDKEIKTYDNDPIEAAENIVKTYFEREDCTLNVYQSSKAFYSPSTDSVTVPQMSQYEVREEYYSTLFHEMTHSTGHETRLNRIVKVAAFGSEEYSKEELVAEMGAAFMCQTLGIDSDHAFNNSAAYVQNWLKQLRNDKKLVVAAAAKAEQAVQFILTGKKPSED
jgi:antirestriction protein ArdC